LKVRIEVLEHAPLRLKMLIKGLPLHVVNSIRRAAMSEVSTMAIDYVIFVENSSVFYDEYIAHRLGLIPLTSENAHLKYKPPEECAEAGARKVFSPDCFAKFDLEAEGPESGVLTIYSGDLIPSDPDVVPVYKNIPILKLIKGQRVKLEALARLGRGKEHSKWSPVSIAAHKYVPTITIREELCTKCYKCVDACPRSVLKVLSSGKVVVDESRLLECSLCKLCEDVCEHKAIKVDHKDDEFILLLELTGALSAKRVLTEAADILIKKLDELREKLVKAGVVS
jgi:DNA-directed RNA polymerase subunit D